MNRSLLLGSIVALAAMAMPAAAQDVISAAGPYIQHRYLERAPIQHRQIATTPCRNTKQTLQEQFEELIPLSEEHVYIPLETRARTVVRQDGSTCVVVQFVYIDDHYLDPEKETAAVESDQKIADVPADKPEPRITVLKVKRLTPPLGPTTVASAGTLPIFDFSNLPSQSAK